MLAIDPPMCRRQRRLQCDLQCSQETCLRTDLWYSACYFYLLTKQLCQTILVFVKAIANWSMALMGIIIFEPTRSDHRLHKHVYVVGGLTMMMTPRDM